MTITPEWVSAVAASISAFGIFFVAVQIIHAYGQMKKDHERSRRELTIQLMKDWTLNLSHSSSAARKLTETFTLEQCKAVYDHKTIKIAKEKKEKVLSIVHDIMDQNEQLKEENDSIVLDEKHVAHIKYLLITYLNTLETTLMAWKLSVADREIIEQEFSYLVKPEDGHEALAVFRQAVGGKNAYPAIHDFVDEIKKRIENSGPQNRDNVA